MFTGIPVLQLADKEAQDLAEAIAAVAAEYELPLMSPRTVAWLNLVGTVGLVYGVRVIAYKNWQADTLAEAAKAEENRMADLFAANATAGT